MLPSGWTIVITEFSASKVISLALILGIVSGLGELGLPGAVGPTEGS